MNNLNRTWRVELKTVEVILKFSSIFLGYRDEYQGIISERGLGIYDGEIVIDLPQYL